jgi:hypothetical protein
MSRPLQSSNDTPARDVITKHYHGDDNDVKVSLPLAVPDRNA